MPFLTVVEAPPRPAAARCRDRLARAAAPRAFNAGAGRAADWRDYTHVMKLDGDIELPPELLRASCSSASRADPTLGLAGGVLDRAAGRRRHARDQDPAHHVHGALKLYTRACFEAIGGVQERLGWDTIDETYARMRGFSDPQLHDIVVDPPPPARQRRRHPARPRAPRRVRLHRPLQRRRGSRCARSRSRAPRPSVVSGLAFFYGYVRARPRGASSASRPRVPPLRPPRAAPAHARRGRAARFLSWRRRR